MRTLLIALPTAPAQTSTAPPPLLFLPLRLLLPTPDRTCELLNPDLVLSWSGT